MARLYQGRTDLWGCEVALWYQCQSVGAVGCPFLEEVSLCVHMLPKTDGIWVVCVQWHLCLVAPVVSNCSWIGHGFRRMLIVQDWPWRIWGGWVWSRPEVLVCPKGGVGTLDPLSWFQQWSSYWMFGWIVLYYLVCEGLLGSTGSQCLLSWFQRWGLLIFFI